MENATPLFQVQQSPSDLSGGMTTSNSRKEPIEMMSYSDVLKNMSADQEPPASTIIPNSVQPPLPTYHSAESMPPQQLQAHTPAAYNYAREYDYPRPYPRARPQAGLEQPETEPVEHVSTAADTDPNRFQNEMLILLMVYVILHTTHVQEMIRRKIPSLVSETTGAVNIMGIVLNGVLLVVLWNVSKRVVLKYMKDL